LSKKRKNKKQHSGSEQQVKSAAVKSRPAPLRNYAILIALLALIFYGNTLSNGFAFDDSVVITGNQFTRQGVKGIPDLVTHDLFAGIYGKSLELTGGRYRPVPLITHAIEYSLWKDQHPGLDHLVNVLLYALAGIVLLFTLNRLFKGASTLAFAAAVLFIIHPIHTEVVANIKSRDEIICFIFLMLTLDQLVQYISSGLRKHFLLSLGCYLLSLLTKEHGITFIAVIPLVLFFFTEEAPRSILRRTVPYLGIAVFYLVFRSMLLHTSGITDSTDVMENPFYGVPFGERLGTVMHIMGKYLALLVFPHPLSCDYSYNQIPYSGLLSIQSLIPFLICLALGVFALLHFKRKDLLSFCILFFFITISIVTNLFFNIGAPMGERFAFLPSLGFCVALAAVLLRLLRLPETPAGKAPAALYASLGLIALPCAFLTIGRNKEWKNNEVLFAADVQKVPESGKANYYYGNVLYNAYTDSSATLSPQRKQFLLATAKQHTLVAARIAPSFFHAHLNLGKIYMEENNADSAIFHLQKVTELLRPTSVKVNGTTRISASEKYIEAMQDLARCWATMKKSPDKGIELLNTALQYGPNNASTLEYLGICHAMKGEAAVALEYYNRSLAINPNNAMLYFNMGKMYEEQLHDQQKADECYQKAKQIGALKP
jgi:tetratricopeptide (TPR) repeat protein